ncbi:MAG: ATP-binding cassette domain-containing protein [Anaerolineae bacterium]|nr:ATP-binding cassette domain-containing protein [Anaerolineae bacterium]
MRIELREIHKHFGALRANDGASLTLEPGRIHGLLGENGAGKTTLMKILSGYQSKDSGDILLDGRAIAFRSPAEALRAGVGMLHQDPLDFPPLTVLDNFLLAFDRRLIPNRQAGRRMLLDLAQRFQFPLVPEALVESLTIGERQQLEIVRLLALGVNAIILDEPTTGISAPQKVQLFKTLQQLAEEAGKIIVFVSHKLEEVEELCDEITVLRHGKVTGHAVMPIPVAEVVRLMFGQTIAMPDKPAIPPGGPLLESAALVLENQRLTVTGQPLTVHSGEVIGFAGMEGSGQSLYLRALAGLVPSKHGQIRLDGERMDKRSYREFLARGVSLLPADRIDEGLVRGLTIAEHFPLRRPTPFFIDWDENRRYSEEQIAFYSIKGKPESAVEALSGGNQQRVLLALQQPNLKILILEHPTRGLDMESTRWVWEQLLKRRETGTAILFTSADLDEIMTYSDRVVVFFNGAMQTPAAVTELSVESLGYQIGGKRAADEPAH